MKTLLLDRTVWDLCKDASGDIAVADAPYALAQDAASAIGTFKGECWYDVTLGIPYFEQVLGQQFHPQLQKTLWVAAAKTVPGVVSAQAYITAFKDRKVSGQVQITDSAGTVVAVAV